MLVHPRTTTGWSAQPWCDLPLDLISVGSPLARQGYRVLIIDQRVEPDWRQKLSHALAEKPVCVGVTSTTGAQLRQALDVSRLVKQESDVPVVWGGVHASLLPEQTLQEAEIDYVVRGEGERTLAELVAALDEGREVRGIPGLFYKDAGRIAHGPPRSPIDLNEEPFLQYDLVDVPKYTRTVFGVKRLSFSTSRGCTFPCAFCCSTAYHGRRWRALRAEVAVEQMKEFSRRYQVRGLFLTDPNFFLDLDRARSILEGVVRGNLGLAFTRLHIRLDALRCLTDEDIALIERAGCRCLSTGVESGSARIRELLHKPIDEGELHDINRRLRRSQIMPLYFFMAGFPTETIDELRATVRLFTKLVTDNPKASKSLNLFMPFPRTEMYELAVTEGLRPPQRTQDWFTFSYRNLGSSGTWLSPRMRKTVEMLDFCSFFVGDRNLVKPYTQTSRLATLAARLYAPIGRARVKQLFYHLPLEIKAARRLGLYGHSV